MKLPSRLPRFQDSAHEVSQVAPTHQENCSRSQCHGNKEYHFDGAISTIRRQTEPGFDKVHAASHIKCVWWTERFPYFDVDYRFRLPKRGEIVHRSAIASYDAIRPDTSSSSP